MKLSLSKHAVLFFVFLVALTLWSTIAYILPDFLMYPTSGFKGLVYTIGHVILMSLPLFLLSYFFSSNKILFSIFVPILFFIGSLISFYSFFYRTSITPMIIDATLNNDLGTTLDMISAKLIIWVIINLILAFIFIKARYKFIKIKYPILHMILALTLIVLAYNFNFRVRNNFNQHYPFNLYFSLNEYFELNKSSNRERILPDSINYTPSDSLVLVFVIGESVRADHLSLNNYKRETTSQLSKQQNLISYPNIYSEYTYTNRSLPHILTRADSTNTELAFTEKSFISLFNQSNFYSSWLANQEAATTYVSFMNECDTLVYANIDKTVYSYSNWLDEDLIPHFDNIIQKENPNKLIILHTIGSHWYYNSHYTEDFEVFKPITNSKILLQNTDEMIINSYDNSILYMDSFVNEIIEKIKDKNSLLIYLSDHGESLGENGNWLHASDGDELKNPAAFVWCSDQYIERYPEKFQALKLNKDNRYHTDFLFHSILSSASIPSKVIEKELDIFYVIKKEEND